MSEGQSGLKTRVTVSLISAIVSMGVAIACLLMPDARVLAVFAVGMIVFCVVFFVVTANKYLLMAKTILGALVAASWGIKGLSLAIHLPADSALNLRLNEVLMWQDSCNLTICFVVVILADVVCHHWIPFLREARGTMSKSNPGVCLDANPGSQSIRSIVANKMTLVQVGSMPSLDPESLKGLLDGEFEKGCRHGRLEAMLEQGYSQNVDEDQPHEMQDTQKTSTSPSLAEDYVTTLLGNIRAKIDCYEFDDAFTAAEHIERIVEAERSALSTRTIAESYVLLANVEITRARRHRLSKGGKENLSKVKYYLEKAKDVKRG